MGTVLRNVVVLFRARSGGRGKAPIELSDSPNEFRMDGGLIMAVDPADYDRALRIVRTPLRKGVLRVRFYIGRRGRK